MRTANFVKIQQQVEEKMIMFRNRLDKLYRHRAKLAKKQGISCYRLYDQDLPEFPLCIEFYSNKLYVAEYKRRHGMDEAAHDNWMEQSMGVISEALGVSRDNIFLKLRQRKPGRLGQYQKFGDEQHEFEAEENGLKFIVNLSDYLDTGLFLDHRITRQRVRQESQGKDVLNLFAYTGSFSVYAAAGNAATVTTVDLSNTYLSWAQRNMQLNGFDEKSKYIFVQADVKAWLKQAPPASFDLVVMDPPTFSNSKRMDDFLDINRDHVELINDCMNLLREGGRLYFSTNSRQFVMEHEKINASSIKDITRATTPFDFEGRLFRWCYYLEK